MAITWSSIIKLNTKLNARLAIRQRADLIEANILAKKIGLPQCQVYTERVFTQLNTGCRLQTISKRPFTLGGRAKGRTVTLRDYQEFLDA